MTTKSVDAIVVGGGIFGAATAYYLSRYLDSILLIERDSIAAHASGWAFGGLSPCSGAGIPGPMEELAFYSFDLHRQLMTKLDTGTLKRVNYQEVESLTIAFTNNEVVQNQQHIPWINSKPGFHARVLSAEELRLREPRINESICGGTLISGSLQVDSKTLTNALVNASGCQVHQANCRRIDHSEGKVLGITTAGGDSFSAKYVILATGPWLPSTAGVLAPDSTYPLKGQILRLQCQGPPITYSIGWGGNYTCSKLDGLVHTGTTEEVAGFNRETTSRGIQKILRNTRYLLPKLQIDRVVKQTACLRPMSRDGHVIVGEHPNIENLYIGSGGGRKGILYGPGIGKSIAELIENGIADVDLNTLNPKRFGSPS